MGISRYTVAIAVFLVATTTPLEAHAQNGCDARIRRRGPCFTPYDQKPVLRNRMEVSRSLVRNYPKDLSSRGIEGQSQVFILLDDIGGVRQTVLSESSGNARLDSAALRVAGDMLFTPARSAKKPVWVWVRLPITFCAKTPCTFVKK